MCESLGLRVRVCAGFPRQAYRRLPTTPTADVANNGAINATGMWKSGDVLHADNGNAWRLERRETERAASGRTLRFNEIFARPSDNVLCRANSFLS